MSSLIVEVCKVSKIEKHPNADRLSVATIKGWNCIVGLDEYKEGDLVIFCPPDSVIPSDLIDKYNLEYLKKNGRVRTVKLREYISQGLILSIPREENWKEGRDVAKELGITKYEPPISCNLQRSGNRPTKKKANPLFSKYTEIENIKNYNSIFKEGDRVVITEKIHGTNFRAGKLSRYKGSLWGKILSFLFGKYEFVYGSHNVQLRALHHKNFYGEDVYGKIAKKYELAKIIPKDYIIYGEIYGKKIQELEYGMKDIDVVFFDVKYKGKYLKWEEMVKFCVSLNLPIVPIFAIENYKFDMLKTYTQGNSSLAFKICKEDHIREGCVIKSLEEVNHPRIGRKILKSVNPVYLLRKNRTEHH